MRSNKDKFIAYYNEIKKGVIIKKECPILDLLFTDGIIIAGKREEERDSRSLMLHSKKPYSQSGTMDPYTARTMINLALARNSILDPMCGVGSILLEASWIGIRCIGEDIDRVMLKKTKENLDYFSYSCDLVQSSITTMPIRRVDSIVTDPPYGRSVNAREVDFERLYEDLFQYSAEVLPKGGRLVFATDAKLDWREKIKEAGLKPIQEHFIYLHKSLSRSIYVVEKP
ncbi:MULTISPECIES: TRM11 family methyltransferase [Acidianus]|uniref:tRNA (guanine(10)-N(2))-dimethyltransferase n=1 Tax=Candidatus Acidianus copahuensis TaxID=1160895 RepID=A0A031LRB1_9CREN|nr:MULTISPECIES: methyltransferase [Acidianus]EZQ06934.1 RNA methyltransferase [Candidatus Acidianus copahuensis]